MCRITRPTARRSKPELPIMQSWQGFFSFDFYRLKPDAAQHLLMVTFLISADYGRLNAEIYNPVYNFCNSSDNNSFNICPTYIIVWTAACVAVGLCGKPTYSSMSESVV